METLALVDTNVLSYIFRKDSRSDDYKEIIREFRHPLISFQTLAEMRFWIKKSNWGIGRISQLSKFLGDFEVVYPEAEVCNLWAEIKHERERLGLPIHPEDAWIAATAVWLQCPIITHDARDFRDITGLRILTAFT